MQATFTGLMFFLIAGLIAGLIYDLFSIFKAITKQNFLVINIVDFVSCIFALLIFSYCMYKFEFGIFSICEIVGFVLGIIFEQIFVKNLFTFPFRYVYNKIAIKKLMRKKIQTEGEKL